MTELGQVLKEARLNKGLSLDDIHKETKIQKRYLEAIEEGNLDALPGHFYARAFVKSYAEVVGIPTDTVLEYIQPEAATPQIIQEPIKPLRRERQLKSGGFTGKWLSRALLYLFAVLILFVIYIAVSEYDKGPKPSAGPTPDASAVKPPLAEGNVSKTQPAPQKTDQNNPATPAPTPAAGQPPQAQPGTAPAAALSFVGQENNVYHYEITGTTDLAVKITAKGDCWMRVQKGGQDGERVDEVTLANGMSKQYSFGVQDAWIRMGSAPDVTVEVNGSPLDTSKMPRASQIVWISVKK